MKKTWIALLLALALLLCAGCAANATQQGNRSADPTVAAPEGAFTDVPDGAWYAESVLWAVEKGITNGLTDTTFGPDEKCNRAQVVTFLWRLAGQPNASGENIFTDVPDGAWYANAVLWAVEKGITNGLTDTTFGPDEKCNRAQIVTFLCRYAGMPAADAENPFTDVPAGAWYTDAVLWAVEKGITNGLTDTTFGPDEKCNRAQIVTFLYRYVQSLDEVPEETVPTEPPVTEPPVTEPPVTEPPVTEPPVTEPPVTEPPVTEPPVTEPPVTEPPVTEPPVTEPPVTEPPVTDPVEPTEDPNMGEWA